MNRQFEFNEIRTGLYLVLLPIIDTEDLRGVNPLSIVFNSPNVGSPASYWTIASLVQLAVEIMGSG